MAQNLGRPGIWPDAVAASPAALGTWAPFWLAQAGAPVEKLARSVKVPCRGARLPLGLPRGFLLGLALGNCQLPLDVVKELVRVVLVRLTRPYGTAARPCGSRLKPRSSQAVVSGTLARSPEL